MSTRRDLQALLNDDQTVAALVRLYDRTARQIVNELAEGISQPGARRVTRLLARINILLARLDPAKVGQLRRWVRRQIPKAYVLGDVGATFELRKVLRAAGRDPASVVSARVALNERSLRGVVSAMNVTLKGRMEEMRRLIGFRIRETQRTLTENAAMREITKGGLLRGRAGKQVSDDIKRMLIGTPDRVTTNRLKSLGFTGEALEDFRNFADHKFIQVGLRRFRVASYADLVARTQMREAHTTGTLIRLQQNNVDFVMISRNLAQEIDVCTPFAGKVFYIGPSDGDSRGFRSLREITNGGPPFHPNCKHVVLPFVVEFKGEEAIANAQASSQALPRRFLGKTPREVDALIKEMSQAERQEAFAEGVADVKPAKAAA